MTKPLTWPAVQAATARASRGQRGQRFDPSVPCVDGPAYRARLIAAGLLRPAPTPDASDALTPDVPPTRSSDAAPVVRIDWIGRRSAAIQIFTREQGRALAINASGEPDWLATVLRKLHRGGKVA